MCMFTMILVIVGGINLGLTGLGTLLGMNLNVLNMILGAWPMVEAILYLLIGIAAVMALICHMKKKCTTCGETKETPPETPSEGAEM